jgi:hypothetical protein
VLNLKKYSKSGDKLPATRPVMDIHLLGKYARGKTIAGCEKVKGIVSVIFSYVEYMKQNRKDDENYRNIAGFVCHESQKRWVYLKQIFMQ